MQFKFRRIIPILAVLLAVLLMTSRSFRLWKETERRLAAGGFYDDCCRDLRMWETKVLNSVNLPAVILSSPIRIWWEYPIYSGKGFGIFTSDIAFIIAIYFFWWWIGIQLDSQRPSKMHLRSRLAYGGLAVLALALFLLGIASLMPKYGHHIGFPIASILWGAGIAVYSIEKVRRRERVATH